ncbi:DUF6940 family protein [Gracilimonas sp. BCB1]|uniref:DUF6940 family protein n=1 Tax=Gracilimonas sp. BCB1 TaxID=3152362 RepID=UPI0032D93F46
MWNILEIESDDNHHKFRITHLKKPISNQQFLELLSEERDFRTFYNNVLKELPFEAFFWENKPMSSSSMHREYEFNVINSNYLANKSPDFETFSSYFKAEQDVVSFRNLGNDAQLIAPCPIDGQSGYAHIGTFIREAPKSQIQNLWKRTGEEMLGAIENEPLWLSTSGLGVFWLHIRIDSVPKYYQTSAYKSVG